VCLGVGRNYFALEPRLQGIVRHLTIEPSSPPGWLLHVASGSRGNARATETKPGYTAACMDGNPHARIGQFDAVDRAAHGDAVFDALPFGARAAKLATTHPGRRDVGFIPVVVLRVDQLAPGTPVEKGFGQLDC